MDLSRYLSALGKWAWLIILATGLAAGVSYRSASTIPRVYQATTTLLVGRSLQTQNPNPGDFQTSQTLAKSYAQLVRSQPVLQATIDALTLDTQWNNLSPEVNASAVDGTELIKISVVDQDPRQAQLIANELAHQLILQSPTPRQGDPQRQFANDQMTLLAGQIKTTQATIASLQKQADQETSATALQDLRSQINVLQQRVDGWQNTYAKLSDFYQGSRTNYLSVVDPATLPTSPVGTSLKYNVALAGALGFCLALAGIVLIEFLDDSIKDPKDVNASLELPILGGIDRLRGIRQPADHLFALSSPQSPAAEACRFFATKVLVPDPNSSKPGAMLWDRSDPRILVSRPKIEALSSTPTTGAALATTLLMTSPGPAEGKSIVASNLGITLANAGKRVVLVDTNLRRPSLHRLFNLSNGDGVTTLLGDDTFPVEGALRSTTTPNLRVLPSGPLPTNPSDMLGSSAMKERLTQLRSIADVIIFDSPAILGAADALVLGTMLDAVILVVRAGRTRRVVAQQAKATLGQVGLEIQGVFLNGYKIDRTHYERYYAVQATSAAPSGWLHCPHLGLRTDPSSVLMGPTSEHRCQVSQRAEKIDSEHQLSFCLTSSYTACPLLAEIATRPIALPSKAPSSRAHRSSTTPSVSNQRRVRSSDIGGNR